MDGRHFAFQKFDYLMVWYAHLFWAINYSFANQKCWQIKTMSHRVSRAVRTAMAAYAASITHPGGRIVAVGAVAGGSVAVAASAASAALASSATSPLCGRYIACAASSTPSTPPTPPISGKPRREEWEKYYNRETVAYAPWMFGLLSAYYAVPFCAILAGGRKIGMILASAQLPWDRMIVQCVTLGGVHAMAGAIGGGIVMTAIGAGLGTAVVTHEERGKAMHEAITQRPNYPLTDQMMREFLNENYEYRYKHGMFSRDIKIYVGDGKGDGDDDHPYILSEREFEEFEATGDQIAGMYGFGPNDSLIETGPHGNPPKNSRSALIVIFRDPATGKTACAHTTGTTTNINRALGHFNGETKLDIYVLAHGNELREFGPLLKMINLNKERGFNVRCVHVNPRTGDRITFARNDDTGVIESR